MVRNLLVAALLILIGSVVGTQQLYAGDLACLTCHSAPSFREVKVGGTDKSIYIDPDLLSKSVHKGKSCLDCHTDFKGQTLPHKQKADPVRCIKCHYSGNKVGAPDTTHIDRFTDSVHGGALQKGDPDAPQCMTCHGSHNIKPATDPKSMIHRTHVAATCGKCHFSPAFVKRHKLKNIAKYNDSVHAKIVEVNHEYTTAAVCTDCHGVHDIKAPGRSESSVSRPNVPETCGKCHKTEYFKYKASIHGTAVAQGVKSAPVCTNCHGEHLINKPSSPESPVYPTHIVATCSKCHEDAKIQRKYGLPADRLSTYMGSFHGVANKYGDITVANCATCHGAHNVLPSSDPRSDVNKNNLVKTCGACHPNASKNFAKGTIHLDPSPKRDVIVFWIRLFYMLFVVGIISSFVGYIILDLRARWIGRLPWRRGEHRK